jgi:hypothetical protein
MNTLEKPPELNTEQILANANRRLRHDLRIQPDDPVWGILALNEELFNAYLQSNKNALKEAQYEIQAAARQAREEAQRLSAQLLENSGNHLEERLQKVGEAWEERFQAMSEHELAKIRKAALYAQIGGFLVLAAGSLALGVAIGRFIFH